MSNDKNERKIIKHGYLPQTEKKGYKPATSQAPPPPPPSKDTKTIVTKKDK